MGSANPTVIRSDPPFFNYWSDVCLSKSLGLANSTRLLDFYQAHIWPSGANHNGSWDETAPFFGGGYQKGSLQLDKPLVLGEFPMGHTIAAGTQTPTQLYRFAYAAEPWIHFRKHLGACRQRTPRACTDPKVPKGTSQLRPFR